MPEQGIAPNPFVYQRPVAAQDLIDRQDELASLLKLADGGHYTRLTAPRRYGKTSLVGGLAAEAERQLGMTAITVDFSRALSIADVAIRIEDAYRGATDGPVKRMLRDLVRTYDIGISLGAGGLAAKLEANPRTDPLPALHRLLDLPAEVFSRTGRRVLVSFDEFQDLLRVEAADGILRSHIQHQGEAASYVFAGSEPGMMAALFEDRERPLFGQAHPVELPPLRAADVADYVAEKFESTGRDAGEGLDPLLQLAEGHPQRAMLLAHYLWDATPAGGTAGIAEWSVALDAAIDSLADGFDRFLDTLPATEVRVLFALALSPHGLYSRYTQARFGLGRGSIRDPLLSLMRRGETIEVGGEVRITDPLLGYWLRQRRRPPAAAG